MSRALAAVGLLLVAAPASGGVLDNVGFVRLRSELGAALPAGRGLHITQIESAVASDHDNNPQTPKIRVWQPDVGVRGLASKPVVVHSETPAPANSRHATMIAQRLIGRHGMARAGTLDVFAVSDWIGDAGLRAFTTQPPRASASRVFNHSWAASLGGGDARILRRVDWLADRDEAVHVVGVRNAPQKTNQPLLAAAFNVIVVGRSDGQHSRGTAPLDDLYVGGRARPHIVVPQKTASAATPVVASAALLLTGLAATPALSTSASTSRTRGGLEVRDAGRPEVLRAVLMASADRSTHNKGQADIEDYGATQAVRTGNGLDVRYGAGQLNVYRAWHLLRAGEQEPSGTDMHRVATTGFDYMPGLGTGSTGAGNPTASYYLETDKAGEFTATLSWHLSFAAAVGERFDASAIINDLDLCLYQQRGEREQLVSTSAGRHDTTENLHLDLSPGQYRLEVRHAGTGDSRAPTRQDYALAWQWRAAGLD